MGILKDYHVRKWIYGILAASFVVLGGYGFVTAEQSDNWLKLAEAALNLVPAAALTLAAAKAKPASSDNGVVSEAEYNSSAIPVVTDSNVTQGSLPKHAA